MTSIAQQGRLAALIAQLRTRAAATGHDRAANLPGGARVAVRVRDGRTAVTVSRRAKPLGDREIVTFQGIIQPPAGAERIPASGQGMRDDWHYVAWRWPTPAPEAEET